jgi:glycosyltransferase involved in cell wall biosynthesis
LAANPGRKTKILFVEHRAGIGGGQIYLLTLLEHLDRSRFDPLVTVVEDGEFRERLRALGVPTQILDIRRLLRKSPLATLRHIRALGSLIERESVDLVHCNFMKTVLLAGPPARRCGVPLIWHSHVITAPGSALFDPVAGMMASLLIANSRYTARRFGKTPGGRGKTRVVYYGVDTGEFTPERSGASVRREIGFAENHLVVGFLGRLEPEKGIDAFVGMIPEVAERCEDARFLIVGRSPAGGPEYRDRARLRLALKGWGERVVFAGFRRDTADCLAAMDLLVVPSLNEAFGLVILEAMAAGKPVVASRVGGIPEALGTEPAGVLLPPGRPGDLVGAVSGLLGDRSKRLELGRTGRRRIVDRFTIQAHMTSIQRIYEELVARI